MSDIQSRLEFALKVAQDAQGFILEHYQHRELNVELKSDASPVTIADRGAEELIRKQLAEAFPDDGVLGEEFPDKPSNNGYRWILDPIDGTKAFVAGVPLFGTLIGIELDSRMVAGVARFPALNEVVYACEGGGCWWQQGDAAPRQTQVTTTSELSQALVCYTELRGWNKIHDAQRLVDISQQVRAVRGWGDCYGHMLVATGRADVAIDPLMNAWDIAALVPIVREAGGFCGSWDGTENIHGNNGVSVNANLRETILNCLNE